MLTEGFKLLVPTTELRSKLATLAQRHLDAATKLRGDREKYQEHRHKIMTVEEQFGDGLQQRMIHLPHLDRQIEMLEVQAERYTFLAAYLTGDSYLLDVKDLLALDLLPGRSDFAMGVALGV